MQCPAANPSVLLFMWTPLHSHRPPKPHWRRSTSASPIQWYCLHHENCSEMVRGTWQRPQSVDLPFKFPRSLSDQESMRHARTSLIHASHRIKESASIALVWDITGHPYPLVSWGSYWENNYGWYFRCSAELVQVSTVGPLWIGLLQIGFGGL